MTLTDDELGARLRAALQQHSPLATDPVPPPQFIARPVESEFTTENVELTVVELDARATSHGSRHRIARRRIAVSLLTAAAAAAAALSVTTDIGKSDRTGSSGLAADHAITSDAAAVAQWAPLVQGGAIACPAGPVPVDALAAEPEALSGTGPDAEALRNFLDHNPFEGMGSVSSSNWVKLQQTPDSLVFGQRVGPLGVGSVVVLSRTGSGFTATKLTTCSGVTLANGDVSSVVDDVHVVGRQLTLNWSAISPDCGRTRDSLREVRVDQSAAAVHVLVVVSRPAPVADTLGMACSLVGTAADTPSTTITLDEPLGDRALYDDGRVSASPIPVGQ